MAHALTLAEKLVVSSHTMEESLTKAPEQSAMYCLLISQAQMAMLLLASQNLQMSLH